MNIKYALIVSPILMNNFRFCRKIFFTIFLFNIFFILISSSDSNLNQNQKDETTVFLENLLIREGGLYTLLGSKPMTLFNVTDAMDTSEEGLAQSYAELKRFLEKAEKDSEHYHANGVVLPDYDEYKKKCLADVNAVLFLHKKRLWDAWLNDNSNISNPTYKLFSRRLSKEKGHIKVGLFINIPQILFILKKYRLAFCQITDTEFDIDKVLDSIEDECSIFWDKVFTSHYLLGLLLGYGEKNAYLFDWMHKQSFPIQAVSILRFDELSRLNQDTKQIRKKNLTINDLPIPYFVSFEIYDKKVESYAKEREKIIEFLKDKDFVSFTLSCLKSKPK